MCKITYRKVIKMKFTKLLAIILAALACISIFAACDNKGGNDGEETTAPDKEVERFDYFAADMKDYVSLDSSLYKGASVTVSSEFLVDDAAVEDYIKTSLYKYRKVLNDAAKITDKPIEFGDTAFIYYRGEVDGKEFEGGSNFDNARPYELGIGSDKFIEGFEDGLIGIIPSETSKENPHPLKLTFPENYTEDLAGKDVIFYVWVVYSVDYELPELTSDFVTKTLKFKTEEEDAVAAYKNYVKEGLLQYRDSAVKNELWAKLLEEATVIKYPESEVQYFYDSYIEQYEYYKKYYTDYGYSFASFDEFVIKYLGLEDGADWKAETTKNSQTDVLQNMLSHAIAQQEGIKVNEEDYQAAVDYYMEYYQNYGQTITREDLIKAVGERLINEYALFEKVNKYLVDNCTISYEN